MPVTKTWYNKDLQHIFTNNYRIERVLRRQTKANGTTEIFV